MAHDAPTLERGEPVVKVRGVSRFAMPWLQGQTMGPMSLDEFKGSLEGNQAPKVSGPLLALWHDARGDWEAAHGLVQSDGSPDGARVHAYLHRKEGDLGNAGYWYRRAGRRPAEGELAAEWDEIAVDLLGR